MLLLLRNHVIAFLRPRGAERRLLRGNDVRGLGRSFSTTGPATASNGSKERVSLQLEELRIRLLEAPESPGVYLFKDDVGNLLYVGKSVNLRARTRSYFRGLPPPEEISGNGRIFNHFDPANNLGRRQATMVRLVRAVEIVVTSDAAEALMLESALIRQRQPTFNVLLKDGRSSHYPYLCVTWSQDYPQIFITRFKRLPSVSLPSATNSVVETSERRDDVYLGPFVDSGKLAQTLDIVRSSLPLRKRWRPLHSHKPCLNYEIGQCPGVCQGLISSTDYRQTIAQAQMVFEGRAESLLEILTGKMKKAAELEAFERAQELKTQITRLRNSERLLGTALHFDASLTGQRSLTTDVWALAHYDKFSEKLAGGGQAISRDKDSDVHAGSSNEDFVSPLSHFSLACVQLFQVNPSSVDLASS